MLLKFNMGDKPLELKNISFVGDGFIIGEHPLTKERCLFLSSLSLLESQAVSVALRRLGLEVVPSGEGEWHNVKFKQLRLKQ